MVRRTLLATLAAGLLLAGPGAAQTAPGSITLDPDQAGRPARAILRAENAGSATTGQPTPQAIVAAFQRGFVFDSRATGARCGPEEGRRYECPRESRIGRGAATVNASGVLVPGGSQDFTATIDVFLGPPAQPWELAAVVVQVSEPRSGQRGTATGRLVAVPEGPFGAELHFEGLDRMSQRAPPGITITLKHLEVTIGAERRVTKTRTVRRRVRTRRGTRVRRRKVRRTVTYHLITNPPTCDGAWEGQVRIRYADHEEVRDGSAACRP